MNINQSCMLQLNKHQRQVIEGILNRRWRSKRIHRIYVRERTVIVHARYYLKIVDQFNLEAELVKYFGLKGWSLEWCSKNTCGIYIVRYGTTMGKFMR